MVPAKNLHQDFAILFRRKTENYRQNLLQRNFARPEQDETGRSLLQEKFLQWRQFVQDRFLNGRRQFAQKSLELFDDVKKQRLIHRLLLTERDSSTSLGMTKRNA